MNRYALLKDSINDSIFGVIVDSNGLSKFYGVSAKGLEWSKWANGINVKSENNGLPIGVVVGGYSALRNTSPNYIQALVDTVSLRNPSINKKQGISDSLIKNSSSVVPGVRDAELRAFDIDKRNEAIAFKARAFRTDSKVSSLLTQVRAERLGFVSAEGVFSSRNPIHTPEVKQAEIIDSYGRSLQRAIGLSLIRKKSVKMLAVVRKDQALAKSFGIEVKAASIGPKIGSRLSGGLRAAPAGMSFVDITGVTDADTDGIVFEGKPGLERPIIPRFMVPKDLARKLSGIVEGDAEVIEKQRRAGNTSVQFDEGKLRNIIASVGGDANMLTALTGENGIPVTTPSGRERLSVSAPSPTGIARDVARDAVIGSRVRSGQRSDLGDATPLSSGELKKLSQQELVDRLIEDRNAGLNLEEAAKKYGLKGGRAEARRLEAREMSRRDSGMRSRFSRYDDSADGQWEADAPTQASLDREDYENYIDTPTFEEHLNDWLVDNPGKTREDFINDPDGAELAWDSYMENDDPKKYYGISDAEWAAGMRSRSSGGNSTPDEWLIAYSLQEDLNPMVDDGYIESGIAEAGKRIAARWSKLSKAKKNEAVVDKFDINIDDASNQQIIDTAIDLAGNEGLLDDLNLSRADSLTPKRRLGMRSRSGGGKWDGRMPEPEDIKPGADLSGANLINANLEGADLEGANLTGADLWGADLNGANLEGANLKNANLTNANLTGAKLTGADLLRADLSRANLTRTQLDKGWEDQVEMRSLVTPEDITDDELNDFMDEVHNNQREILDEIFGAPTGEDLDDIRANDWGFEASGPRGSERDYRPSEEDMEDEWYEGNSDVLRENDYALAREYIAKQKNKDIRNMQAENWDDLSSDVQDRRFYDAFERIFDEKEPKLNDGWGWFDEEPKTDFRGYVIRPTDEEYRAANGKWKEAHTAYLQRKSQARKKAKEEAKKQFEDEVKKYGPGGLRSRSGGMRLRYDGGKWDGRRPEPEDIKPGADLSGAQLSGMDLEGRDLTGVNLYQANLLGAKLSNVNLSGANLHGARIAKTNLKYANLTGADLRDTKLYGADLRYAKLSGADLLRADLRQADLRDADLRDADLTDANLEGANLKGAILDKGWEQKVGMRSRSGGMRSNSENPDNQIHMTSKELNTVDDRLSNVLESGRGGFNAEEENALNDFKDSIENAGAAMDSIVLDNDVRDTLIELFGNIAKNGDDPNGDAKNLLGLLESVRDADGNEFVTDELDRLGTMHDMNFDYSAMRAPGGVRRAMRRAMANRRGRNDRDNISRSGISEMNTSGAPKEYADALEKWSGHFGETPTRRNRKTGKVTDSEPNHPALPSIYWNKENESWVLSFGYEPTELSIYSDDPRDAANVVSDILETTADRYRWENEDNFRDISDLVDIGDMYNDGDGKDGTVKVTAGMRSRSDGDDSDEGIEFERESAAQSAWDNLDRMKKYKMVEDHAISKGANPWGNDWDPNEWEPDVMQQWMDGYISDFINDPDGAKKHYDGMRSRTEPLVEAELLTGDDLTQEQEKMLFEIVFNNGNMSLARLNDGDYDAGELMEASGINLYNIQVNEKLAKRIEDLMVERDNKRLDAQGRSTGIAKDNARSVIKHWQDSVDDDPDKMGDLLSSYEGDLVAAMEDHYDDYLNGQLDTFENRRESGMRSRSGGDDSDEGIQDDYVNSDRYWQDYEDWMRASPQPRTVNEWERQGMPSRSGGMRSRFGMNSPRDKNVFFHHVSPGGKNMQEWSGTAEMRDVVFPKRDYTGAEDVSYSDKIILSAPSDGGAPEGKVYIAEFDEKTGRITVRWGKADSRNLQTKTYSGQTEQDFHKLLEGKEKRGYRLEGGRIPAKDSSDGNDQNWTADYEKQTKMGMRSSTATERRPHLNVAVTGSSALRQASFNEEKDELVVTYANGKTYTYENLSHDDLDEILYGPDRILTGNAINEVKKKYNFREGGTHTFDPQYQDVQGPGGEFSVEKLSRLRRGGKSQIPVSGSSAIEALTWDDDKKDLIVTYAGGRTYTYKDVDSYWIEDLERETGTGRIINNIKKEGYRVVGGGEHGDMPSEGLTAERAEFGMRSRMAPSSGRIRAAEMEISARPQGMASRRSEGLRDPRFAVPGRDRVDPSDGELWGRLSDEEKTTVADRAVNREKMLLNEFKQRFPRWWDRASKEADKKGWDKDLMNGGNAGWMDELHRFVTRLADDPDYPEKNRVEAEKQFNDLQALYNMRSNRGSHDLLEHLNPTSRRYLFDDARRDDSKKTRISASGKEMKTPSTAPRPLGDPIDTGTPIREQVGQNEKKPLKARLDAYYKRMSDKILYTDPARQARREMRKARRQGINAGGFTTSEANPVDDAKRKIRRRKRLKEMRKNRTRDIGSISDSSTGNRIDGRLAHTDSQGSLVFGDKLTSTLATMMKNYRTESKLKKTKGGVSRNRALAVLWDGAGYNGTPHVVTPEEFKALHAAGWVPVVRGHGSGANGVRYANDWIDDPVRFITGQGGEAQGEGEYWARPTQGGGGWFSWMDGSLPAGTVGLLPPSTRRVSKAELGKIKSEHAPLAKSIKAFDAGLPSGEREKMDAEEYVTQLRDHLRTSLGPVYESTMSTKMGQMTSKILESLSGSSDSKKQELLDALEFLELISTKRTSNSYAPLLGYDTIMADSGVELIHNRTAITIVGDTLTRDDAVKLAKSKA